MTRQLAYLVFVIFMAVLPIVSTADDSILGEWLSVERTKGGLGATKIYSREGIVTATFGALVDFSYKVAGGKVTLSISGADDIVQTFQINDAKLVLKDSFGNTQELTRMTGDAKSGIIGKWIGDHYTGQKQILHFTKSNNCYLSVPVVSKRGSYELGTDKLIEAFEREDKQYWKWSIKNNILKLTSSTQGKTEKYIRKK